MGLTTFSFLENVTEVRKYLDCVASSKISSVRGKEFSCMPLAKLKGEVKDSRDLSYILQWSAEWEDEFLNVVFYFICSKHQDSKVS